MLCTLFTAFKDFARPYSSISTQLSAPQITPHNQYREVDVFLESDSRICNGSKIMENGCAW
jgi:hypothetical protein